MDDLRIQYAIKNLGKDLAALEYSVKQPISNIMIVDSLVRQFEAVLDLFFEVLRYLLKLERGIKTNSKRELIAEAYQSGLLKNKKVWMDILACYNSSSNFNDFFEAKQIYDYIRVYIHEIQTTFISLESRFKGKDVN